MYSPMQNLDIFFTSLQIYMAQFSLMYMLHGWVENTFLSQTFFFNTNLNNEI